mmetsp:Transcript_44479/g.102652  ORF Transcript_44479/g.102652 Transcript_44479/m.102652 type:complete len:109 (+) Transcript_44479:93-419(+)
MLPQPGSAAPKLCNVPISAAGGDTPFSVPDSEDGEAFAMREGGPRGLAGALCGSARPPSLSWELRLATLLRVRSSPSIIDRALTSEGIPTILKLDSLSMKEFIGTNGS